MKLTRSLLPAGLTLAVLVSIVLSALIWTNPAQYERNRQRNTNNPTTELNTRPKKDVFLPTQVVYSDATGGQELLNNRKVNLTTAIRDALTTAKPLTITPVRVKNRSAYLNYVNRRHSLLLSYSSPVTVGLFNQVFGGRLALTKTQISRILIPIDGSTTMYLLNDRGYRVYRVRLRTANDQTFKQIVSGNLLRMPVAMRWLNDHAVAYFTKSVSVPSYSYLINRQSNDYFTTRLLNQGEATNVNVKRTKAETIYSDSSSRQLTVQNKSGNTYFEDYNAKRSTLSYPQQLDDSYQDVVQVGIPMDNLRFFDYDRTTSSVMYRSFVEGFPIFNQGDFGSIRVQLLKEGIRRYYFSLYSLQVPVPTGSNPVTIESTDNVVGSLQAAGLSMKKVTDIQLGYQWTGSHSSDKVVDLTPTWYIRYNGNWKTLQQLLNNA